MTRAKWTTPTGGNGAAEAVERPRRRAGGRPFGDSAHPLSPSEAGKLGAAAAAAVKRERSKSVGERFRERLEAEAEDLYGSFRDAWLAGDWRALVAALDRAYGRPPQQIVGDPEQPVSFQLVSAFVVPDVGMLEVIDGELVDEAESPRELEAGSGAGS